MIDFIKIKISDCNTEKLVDNPLLDFHRSVSEKTGLMDTKTIANHHHCKITIYDSGTIIFSGSIHKMYNSIKRIEAPIKNVKGFNGNQFNWQEIDFSLKYLVSLFEVEKWQMHIQQIEYGQNLIIPFSPQDFIASLLMHQSKPFEFRYNEFYAQCVHSNYVLKIYNKGNQYGMSDNVLRIEIKVLKMRFQKDEVGMITVADITPKRLERAFGFLIEQLNKIIYCDNTIHKRKLTKVDKNRLQKYNNPNYWKKLKPNKRHQPKKILANLIEKNSQNLKVRLVEELEKNRVRFHQLFKKQNGVRFHTSNIGGIITLNLLRKHPLARLSLDN